MWPSRPSSSHDGHVTATTAKLHDYQRHSTSSNSSSGNAGGSHGSHMTKRQLVVPDNVQPFSHMHTRPSSSNSTYDSSHPYLTTSDYSSSKSLPPFAVQPATSSSQQTSFTGYSSTHTTSSGLSSISTATHRAPPMVATTTSLMANYPSAPHHSKNLTNGNNTESLPRPASLSINRGGMHTSPSHSQKVSNQQTFQCPSCRKQFQYGPKEFDQWFEHIRYCENKP